MTRVARDLFAFLAELRRHNDRVWFNANKDRYLADVRDPMLEFIGSIAAPLARISRHIVVDPRPSGGSLMRIYRDARFSEHQACAPDFSARFVAACRRAVPLMRFLTRAMGLAF